MSIEELSQYSISEVLNNERLFLSFKALYKEIHGVYPTCASCAVANEFRKLLTSQQKLTFKGMEYKFRSPKGAILTFTNDKGKVVRRYDTDLNDEFVMGYLTPNKYQSEEVIEERKKQFKTLVLPQLTELTETTEEVKEAVTAEQNIVETPVVEEKPKKKRAPRKKKD